MDIRLGRLQKTDERDKLHLLSAVARLPVVAPPTKSWRTGPVLDQGQTSECVAFSWEQWLVASPVRNKTGPPPDKIYADAQAIDEWAGTPHDGTSVRAGAKVLQSDGYISRYVWADSIDSMANWILTVGPMVIGVNWYDGMFSPPRNGIVSLTGEIAGGHAICVNGFNSRTGLFRLTNSWGVGWGQKGRFFIRKEDMRRLIFDEDGEAVTATEQLK